MDKKDQFASWLPVEQLWPLLIGVACQHTGQERLKVIGLLMELINFQCREGEGERWKKKMQLSDLKPLWQLYTTVIKEFGKENGGGVRGMENSPAWPCESCFSVSPTTFNVLSRNLQRQHN